MAGTPHNSHQQAIDQFIDDLVQLSRSGCTRSEFYDRLAQSCAENCRADGVAVWQKSSDDRWHCLATSRDSQRWFAGLCADDSQHPGLLAAALASGKFQSIPVTIDERQAPQQLLMRPFVTAGAVSLLMEIGLAVAAESAALGSYEELLNVVVEMALDYEQRHRASVQGRLAQGIAEFAADVHASLDPALTAASVVNAGRRLLDCDRLALVVPSAGQMQIQAVSGVDEIDRRSGSIRLLESACSRVGDEPNRLWWPDDERDDLPTDLQEYLAAVEPRRLALLPVGSPNEPLEAVLIAEWFHGSQNNVAVVPQAVETLVRQSELALRHSRESQQWIWQRWSRRRHWPRWAVSLAMIALCVAGLCLIPADLEITTRGELQPTVRRDVFATSDGIISELNVSDEQGVAAGDVLFVLTNPDLDFRMQRTTGELETARERLTRVQRSRRGESRLDVSRDTDATQWAIEEQQLLESIVSLEEQAQLLKAERESLQIRSPISGHVLTWNLEEILQQRPVQRGHRLATVADTQGTWQLELRVPDHLIGHVLDAAQTMNSPVNVDFRLATDPETSYSGTLVHIADTVEQHATDGPFVQVDVMVDAASLSRLRPGTSVRARIACGQRAIGYAWFHELIDGIRARFFL